MATLAGKITDVTGKSPETISSITVKAPRARIGGAGASSVIVTSPATVTFDAGTGNITISGITEGLSWLFLEGDGWSDSIALAVAEGMVTLVEAVANASGVPGLIDFIDLLEQLRQNMQDFVTGEFARNSTSSVGHTGNAGRNVQLDTSGKLQIVTSQVTREQDVTSKGYVDNALQSKVNTADVDSIRWKKSNVTSSDTLDSLAEGTHEVRSGAISNSLGIPFGVIGSLTISNLGGARVASYITNHATNPREYINSRVNGVWSGWSVHASFRDLESKADKSSLSGLATEQYVDDAIAGIGPSDPPAPAINMALLGAPVTPWESAGIVTNYDQGELYLDQLKAQFVFVKKVTVGQTYLGKDINALVIGDDTKPVVMIECGIHGNEVASREAVMIWARKAAQYRTWMDDICLVIIPTVNGDRTGHNRENAQSKDINRDFGNFETSEARAVRDAFDTYNPFFYLCCHEFDHTSDVNDIETSSPSNYAWFTNQNIIDVTDRVVGKIWTAVQDKGATVDHYYTTSATEPEGPVDTAMSWLMRVKEVPSVLIETAGGLYPKTYSNHVGVHPARYSPPLDWRVDLYHAALDAALGEIGDIISEKSA